jgi:siroheme synthase
MTSSSRPEPGSVHMVGAGPGDPGLITVRAVQCLQQADLVLYDYLANPTLVDYAPEGAELVRLGRHDQGRSLTPDEITDVMVKAALDRRLQGRGNPLRDRSGHHLGAGHGRLRRNPPDPP